MEVRQGDTIFLSLQRRNKTTGLPVNLTGVTIRSKLKNRTNWFPFSVAVTNAVAGRFTLTIPAELSSSIPPDTYFATIRFETTTSSRSTQTFEIKILKAIT